MIHLDELRNSVNLYRGALRFTFPLATLPQSTGDGYVLNLTYDSGDVDATAVGWNLSRPTGVAGLGWTLETHRIDADYGDPLGSDGCTTGPRLSLRFLGERYELIPLSSSGGQTQYAVSPYQFWKLTYTSATETWLLITEDGTQWTFGGATTQRHTVDWGYAWDGWIGATVQTAARAAVAVGWSLAQFADISGNTTVFSYVQTSGSLGTDNPASYTQATYLDTVVGPQGGRLKLSYIDKQPDEYENPHAGATSSAWQSRYETKALSTVTATPPGGGTPWIVTLGYARGGINPVTVGTGDRTKRLLMSVASQADGAYALPPVSFEYDQNSVSTSYGAMLKAITPSGGEAVFAYARPTLTLPQRSFAIPTPTKSGVTYSNPRCAFGDDYAFVMWLGSDQSIAATAYRWEGRWLPASVGTPAVASAADYQALHIAAGRQCFAVVGATTYTLFAVDPSTPGAWIGSTAPEPTNLPSGEAVVVAAGPLAIGLVSATTGAMVFRWFDGQAWQTTAVPDVAGTEVATLGVSGTTFVRYTSGSATDQQVTLVYPDLAAGWTSTPFVVPQWTTSTSGLSIVVGDTYAILGSDGYAGADRVATYSAVWWDASLASLLNTELVEIPLSGGATAPVVQIRGASALVDSHVFRFDGQAWTSQDLSALAHPNQQVLAYSLGADVVTRTVQLSTGIAYDLIVYDPTNTTTSPWGYAASRSGIPAKTGTSSTAMAARFDFGYPALASRYVLFNNQLYLLGSSGTWTSILDVTDTFSAATLPSLQLFGERYLVYQTSAGVVAYTFREGGLADLGADHLPHAQILPGSGQPLAGQNAFIAYTGTWGTDEALTLYRPVAEACTGALTPLTLASMTLYGNGGSTSPTPPTYNTVSVALAYNPATATVSDDGFSLASNQSGLAQGTLSTSTLPYGIAYSYFFNRLTPAETPALAYPTGPSTNASANLGYLAGITYAQTSLTGGGSSTEVFGGAAWWWASVVRAGARRAVAYARCRQSSSDVDSVPDVKVFAYDPNSGLVVKIDGTTPDGKAQETLYTYWWQKYDPTNTLNLLSPIVQTMETVDGTLVRGSVVTWQSKWGFGTRWAPNATYVATSANPADFTAWTSGPIPAGWALDEEITARGLRGQVLATRNPLGQVTSSIFSGDGFFQIATLANADVKNQEAYYYGFEPYELPGAWRYVGGTIPAHLVPGEANLGSQSLSIAVDATGATGLRASFAPAGQDRAYLFGAWVQTSPNFASTSGTAQFTVTIATVGSTPTPVGSPIVLSIPATNGNWQYVSVAIPLGAIRAAHSIPPGTQTSVTIFGTNQKADAAVQVLVDGLRFQPSDSTFYAAVQSPSLNLALGSLGPNGATTHLIRDPNALVLATVGPDPTVARLSIPSFARLLTSDGLYADALPNMLLDGSGGDAAIYQNFEASDASQWTLPSGWTMANGSLTFSGSATPPGSAASLTAFSNPNYVAFARYVPVGSSTPDVGIGCGNVLVYFDSAAASWKLTYQSGGTWQTPVTQPGTLGRGDLVFAILGGRASFFVSGRQILTYLLPNGVVPDGKLNLYLSAAGSFQDLVAQTNPDLKFVMIDGRGIAEQSIDLIDGGNVDAHGLLYSPLGLVGYEKNPIGAPIEQSGNLIAGGPTNYLPSSADDSITQYIAPGNGSPFEQLVHETSPLLRLTQMAQPGDDLSIASGHAAKLGYARNTASGPMSGLVPNAQAGNYELVTATDPDQGTSYALMTPDGQVVYLRTSLPSADSLTVGYSLDAANRIQAVQPPNSFVGPLAGSGWNTVYQRDFLGRVLAVESPDTGQTQYAYDSLGRLRFEMDAVGAALNPVRILYYKYDGLSREIERGLFSNASITWASAIANVDIVAWPGPDQSPTVLQTSLYDVDPGTYGVTNAEGRLTQVRSFATTLQCQETYSYNLRGNVVTYWSQAPDYDAAERVSTYIYDQRNRLLQISYPRKTTDSDAPLTVVYGRDDQGRIVTIGRATSGQTALYANIAYNPDGTIQGMTYENPPTPGGGLPLSFAYTPAAWPSSITTPVYAETLTYTAGGYASGGYYDGQVASIQSTWSQSSLSLYPIRSTLAQYAYDAAGRLTAATPYLAPATGGSTLAISYDANGNYQAVARGLAPSAYSYPYASNPGAGLDASLADEDGTPSNRLVSVTTPASASYNFESTPPPLGWTWNMTNGGAGPAIVDGGPTGSTKCLQIPGASVPGANGYLSFKAPLDPRGQYTLAYDLLVQSGFDSQEGDAAWYIRLYGPEGIIATRLVQSIDAATTWTSKTAAIDVATLYTGSAPSQNIVAVEFILLNEKRATDGGWGAWIQVDNLTVSGSGGTGTLVYDADGRITSIPNSGVTLGYEVNSIAPSTVAEGGFSYAVSRNGGGQPIAVVKTPVPSGATEKLLSLYSPAGLELGQCSLAWDGTETVRYKVAGPQGIFVVEDNGTHSYIVRGADSAPRAVMSSGGDLLAYVEQDALGRDQNRSGPLELIYPVNFSSFVYPRGGTMYDSYMGRFTAPPVPLVPVAPAAGGYAGPSQPAAGVAAEPGYLYRAYDLVFKMADRGYSITTNLAMWHLKEAPRYIQHNPDAWGFCGSVLDRLPRAGAFSAVATRLSVVCWPYQFLGAYRHAWWLYGQTCPPGQYRIQGSPYTEDYYHNPGGYGSLESVGGKKLVQRSVEVIPDGYYIFVVNPEDQFLYREMYDRDGSTELYVRHSMLNNGRCAKTAGMMKVTGKLIELTDSSGHYQPDERTLQEIAVPLLQAQGYGPAEGYRFTTQHWESRNLKEEMMEYLKHQKVT